MGKLKNSTLAVDIGGTNARFGCLTQSPDGFWTIASFLKFPVANYMSFNEALEYYLQSLDDSPIRIAISAAGPVLNNRVKLTNAQWELSTQDIIYQFGFEACGIYNDFCGMTRSIPELRQDQLILVREGTSQPNAPILVAGPGTGFGVGYLVPTRAGWHVVPSEGGHVAYAPQTDIEYELLKVLKRDHKFVSLELVSSGMGLPFVHRAVCEIFGKPYAELHPDEIRARASRKDPICQNVCEVRATAAMGAIGDFALAGGAQGGIVLAGGVSERMIDFYKMPAAMDRFLNRGTHSEYVKNIPIHLLKSPGAPLIGAAALLNDAA